MGNVKVQKEMIAMAHVVSNRVFWLERSSTVKSTRSFALVGGLLLAVCLGCANQKNANSVKTTNQTVHSNSTSTTNQKTESTLKIPPDSVPTTEITRDFDDKRSDLQAAIRKWRNKRITFHGTVYTTEKGDSGKFKVSLVGHDNFFTVYCRDIPASQASIVAKLKEDETIIAISGVILGNGITGLVPGHVDHDVIAEKCRIVE